MAMSSMLNDVPVQFGRHKRYRDRQVTVLSAANGPGERLFVKVTRELLPPGKRSDILSILSAGGWKLMTAV